MPRPVSARSGSFAVPPPSLRNGGSVRACCCIGHFCPCSCQVCGSFYGIHDIRSSYVWTRVRADECRILYRAADPLHVGSLGGIHAYISGILASRACHHQRLHRAIPSLDGAGTPNAVSICKHAQTSFGRAVASTGQPFRSQLVYTCCTKLQPPDSGA